MRDDTQRGPDPDWAALRLHERLAANGVEAAARAEEAAASGRWRDLRRSDIERTREPPAGLSRADWALRCEAAYASAAHAAGAGWLNAVLPLTTSPRARVRAAADDLGRREIVDPSPLTADLESALWPVLNTALKYTLVLEMGAARRMGLLVGDTPAARFDFFCAALGDPRFSAALLGQYPVLLRRLDRLVLNWEAASLEILARLNSDIAILRELIGADPGPAAGVTALGDSHAQGRRVSRLTFRSGAQAIYKPRPCAAEAVWEHVVAHLNAAGLSPDLEAARVVDRGDYGWVEAVVRAPCADASALRRFFRRQGAQIALAHVLGLEDAHFENVIPAGEYPVIVDAEAMFLALPRPEASPAASREVARRVQDSVWRSFLVPWPGERARDDGDLEVSALGYAEGQAFTNAVVWSRPGRDDASPVKRRMPVDAEGAAPKFAGAPARATDHVDDIVAGLEAGYALLGREADALLAPDGALGSARARTCRTRRILRATDDYDQILEGSWHPRHGRDATAFEAYVRNGLRKFGAPKPADATPQDDEVDAIFQGDIPVFTGAPDTTEVVAEIGAKPVWRSARPGWDEMADRMRSISTVEVERQAALVRLSLGERPRRAEMDADPDALGLAVQLGDRLAGAAVRTGGGANWLTLTAGPRGYIPGACGADLYEGLAGIAVFLAALAARTGRPDYAELAGEAVSEALALHRTARDVAPGGAFTGVGSLAYGLAFSGRLLDRPDWCAEARTLIVERAEGAARQKDVDLIAGTAGFLLVGLAIAPDDERLRDVLRPCAERLLSLAEKDLPRAADAGLGHGRAGVGLALERWSAATGDRRARAHAKRLVEADARALGSRGVMSWCRGSLGLCAACDGVDPLAEGADPSSGPLCLCHGLAGLISLTGRGAGSESASRRRLCEALARRTAAGDLPDEGLTVETPGLMTGLAGIGWALLELDDPALPNILSIEAVPPSRAVEARLTA